jgi:hypothetical protein
MGRSYFYSFSASADKTAAELESFLQTVETKVKQLGYAPTMVVNARFDTPEQQEFARRLTTGLKLESEKLKGMVLVADGQIWGHDPVAGFCRVIPQQGVLLIVTNERGHESAFGFFRHPETLKDLNGRDMVKTGAGKRWTFQDFVDSPDPRYRQIVKLFADAGYCDGERDEYAPRKEKSQ